MKTAIAAEQGYSDVWLLELVSSGGTLRFTNAPEDQLWDSNTWSAIGGEMAFEEASESEDMGAQRVGISLGGVDQTIIAVLLGNDYRGYACIVYFGQIDLSDGAVVDDPMAVFTGLLNESWTVREQLGDRGPGTVTIRTTVVGEVGAYRWYSAVRTNLQSHNDMLDRASISVGDTFFKTVPDLSDAHIKWGAAKVAREWRPPSVDGIPDGWL
tara:strand:+ start:10922 stop:11557 length:636 start_codon:yes stop_codon:yes gene_type:complete